MSNRYDTRLRTKRPSSSRFFSTKGKAHKTISVVGDTGSHSKILDPGLQEVDGDFDSGSLLALVERPNPLDYLRNRILKRLLDILISLIVIFAIHLWLTPLVGLIIRLTSRGHSIFRQKRIGKNGSRFTIHKYRTMSNNHHASKEAALAGIGEITQENDARLTTVGKWLRKTNIDEFPQFFNVLLGNMSVVGPRPYMVSEDAELEQKIERYALRRRVKPGMTGWAQVNGYRGGTKDMALMQKRTDHDIWYIENWSFWLDIRIIVRTFWLVVVRGG